MPAQKIQNTIPASAPVPAVDIAKFAEFIEKGDADGAKALLEAFLAAPFPREDKVRLYMEMMSAYLSVRNQIDDAQKEELESIVSHVKELTQQEKEVDEKVDLLKVRANLR